MKNEKNQKDANETKCQMSNVDRYKNQNICVHG